MRQRQRKVKRKTETVKERETERGKDRDREADAVLLLILVLLWLYWRASAYILPRTDGGLCFVNNAVLTGRQCRLFSCLRCPFPITLQVCRYVLIKYGPIPHKSTSDTRVSSSPKRHIKFCYDLMSQNGNKVNQSV